MKLKKFVLVIAVLLATGTLAYFIRHAILLNQDDGLLQNKQQEIVQVYNIDDGSFLPPQEKFHHYTLKWINAKLSALPEAELTKIAADKQPLYIDLQVWPEQVVKGTGTMPSDMINNGRYDEKLAALAVLLAKCTQPVYLSYNAEMDVPDYTLPWQNHSGFKYIQSFRRIAGIIKKKAAAIKMVWAPRGYPGAEEYWPGKQYADYCAVYMYGLKDMFRKQDIYPAYSSEKEMIRRKIFRMRFCGRPVLLLGTEKMKKENLQPKWLTELTADIKSNASVYNTPAEPYDTDSNANFKQRKVMPEIGVYDPDKKIVNNKAVTCEHIFIHFDDIENGNFEKEFGEVVKRNHKVIVTFECYKDRRLKKDKALIQNILSGFYDSSIAKVFTVISAAPVTVYLRWGHEMEIPVDRYPWQLQDPVQYIRAYRYVAAFRKPLHTNIKLVWGPAGDKGSIEWYPGDDVVDYVSVAIYGLPDKNINDYNKQLSFNSIFKLKFHRLRFAHKPFFITEFGVKGPETYKQQWLQGAAFVIKHYPVIEGVSYFNFADVPKAWGDAETPVWTISEPTFDGFTRQIE